MQRASRAWHLRVTGMTWEQVAREVGFASPQGAHRAVQRFAGTLPDPKPDELRALWRARMEHLWELAARDAEASRPGALRAGVAIADRASRFDGLDAPTVAQIEVNSPEFDRLFAGIMAHAHADAPVEAEVIELEVMTEQ